MFKTDGAVTIMSVQTWTEESHVAFGEERIDEVYPSPTGSLLFVSSRSHGKGTIRLVDASSGTVAAARPWI